MARISCNYHPRTAARWHCPRCETSLCPGCVRKPSGPFQEHPDCPLCDQPVESLGLGNVIVPFWWRLPRIFAYPLQPTALIYLLGLSLVGLAVPIPLVGIFVVLLIALAILQYGFRVLAHTARGHMHPPEINMRSKEDVTPRVVALFLVYILVGYLARMAGHYLGLPGFLLATLFFSLMLPASILIVGLEQGLFRILFKAVSPLSLTALALRIGPAYLLLFLFMQLLFIGGRELTGILAVLVPTWGAAGAIAFGWMYMHLVTFHLLGYVIYQYHEELGFEVDVRDDRSGGRRPEAAQGSGQSVLGQVEVLLKEGQLVRAEELLCKRLDADPTDLEVWKRYYRVLQARGDDGRLVEESKDYISALLLAGRVGPALEVAAQALGRDPDFRPAKPEQVHLLAKAAREVNRPKLALQLMNGFGRQHPEHPDLPAVSVLFARILSEDLQQDGKARPILEALLKRFPDHPAATEARRLLGVIGTA